MAAVSAAVNQASRVEQTGRRLVDTLDDNAGNPIQDDC